MKKKFVCFFSVLEIQRNVKNVKSILSYIHCIRFAFQWFESEHLFWQHQKTIEHSEQSCHIDCLQIDIHIDGFLSINTTSLVAIYPPIQGSQSHCDYNWHCSIIGLYHLCINNSTFDLNQRHQTSHELNLDLQNQKWLYLSLSYTPFYLDCFKSFNSNGELMLLLFLRIVVQRDLCLHWHLLVL